MSAFRNLIARRRPVSGPVAEAPLPGLHPPEAAPPASTAAAAPASAAEQDRPSADWSVPHWQPATHPPATMEGAARDAPRIWDLDPGEQSPAPTRASAPAVEPDMPKPVAPDLQAAAQAALRAAGGEAPAPLPERRPQAAGRAKTRLLGFQAAPGGADAFDARPAPAAAEPPRFPIGWLVVVEGPGRGASFTLSPGLSSIGRDPGQTVPLDFGDPSISREAHAAIAYDEEENRTLIGHGGKTNLVRLNGEPLLTNEELSDGDLVRIGKTTLRYIALCGPDFAWSKDEAEPGGEVRDD